MEPAFPQKNCKAVTWPSWWHPVGSALSFATSTSRLGSASRSTQRGVHLDLKMLRAGLWGNSCCCWMGSVWGDKAYKRERVHPCNIYDRAFKSLQGPNHHIIWQHSGHMFVFKGCGKKFKTNNRINRHKKLFWFQASPQEELLQLLHVGHTIVPVSINDPLT